MAKHPSLPKENRFMSSRLDYLLAPDLISLLALWVIEGREQIRRYYFTAAVDY